jgi:hypothetical protein
MVSEELNVVVRLHDHRRTFELERCLFSLVCQSYRPIEIVVVTQRFSQDEFATVSVVVERLRQIDPSVDIRVINYEDGKSGDARSALINHGIAAGNGRYLAFLDYDDIIHHDAYDALIEVLRSCSATAAFGRIRAKFLEVQEDTHMTRSIVDLFARCATVIDQFLDNHFPIHSFVVDRFRIDAQDLYFEQSLSRLEDYDFLIRLCAKYPTDFILKNKIVGDYSLKDDGSNTVLHAAVADVGFEQHVAWQAARRLLEARRAKTEVSVEVQRRLRIGPLRPGITVKKLLDGIPGRG